MKIQFSTDNAAFCDDNGNPSDIEERLGIIDILMTIKYQISQGVSYGTIKDINGNIIGSWSM